MNNGTEIAIVTPGAERMPGERDIIRSGSWWRPVAAAEVRSRKYLAEAIPPDHGLVLLVSEVHQIDGQIHSVTLHPHPGWEDRTPVRLLAEEFLRDFAEEGEGETLREREIGLAMGRTQEIVSAMSQVPADEDLLRLQPPQEAPAETSGVRVPDALIPGGDLRAARASIERVMAIANARQGWIEARSRDMRASMAVVVAYQAEKVQATTAEMRSISARAGRMLRNVRSMDLWLGQGVELGQITTGAGASPDEPLTFYQRMLYLDEELHVGMLLNRTARQEGFSWRDLGKLPEILAGHPDILERMMPSPRSVVIARIRRKDRPIRGDLDLAGVFAAMADREPDKQVFIFIRDGQNVRMVRADPETAAATRLFPGKAEIDALFQAPAGYDRASRQNLVREIRPDDLDYVEARQAHDDRALHYKRFLLILWGLHEREGAFGDFLPEGSNWLSETVHSARFRFIHDDEGLLADNRPSLRDWIAAKNGYLRSGSTVILEPGKAVHCDSAPTIAETRGDRCELKRRPIADFLLVTPGLRGAQLVASVETRRFMSDRAKATPVILRHADGRTNDHGTLCLDRVRAQELRAYIDDRRARENYLDYLELFVRALEVCEAREAEEAPLARRLIERRPEREADIRDVLVAQQESASGAVDETDILERIDHLGAARGIAISDGERLILTRTGRLRRQSLALSGPAERLRLPLLVSETCTQDRSGALEVQTSSLDPILSSLRPGEIVVADRIGQQALMARIGRTQKGMVAPSLQQDILRAFSEDPTREAAVRSILARSQDWPDVQDMIGPMQQWGQANGGGMVRIPDLMVCAGIAMVPDTRWDTSSYRKESPETCPGHYPHRALAIYLSINPIAQSLAAGRSDVIEACSRFYRNRDFGLEDLQRSYSAAPPLRITVARIRDEESMRAALRNEPWLGERHEVSLKPDHVFRIRDEDAAWSPPRTVQGAIARCALLRTAYRPDEVTRAMIAEFDWFLPRVDLVAPPGIGELLEAKLFAARMAPNSGTGDLVDHRPDF